MSDNKPRATAAKPDGRIQRSERSRKLIIDALQDLIMEGVLVPTAQQVADRAQVGIRTVFRHFADMETLFASIDEKINLRYEAIISGGDRSGVLEQRIAAAVELRAGVYDAVSPMALSTHAQMWRWKALRKRYQRSERVLRGDLERWLPELRQLPQERLEAVHAAASFETWDRLRSHQGLSKKAAVAVVGELLNCAF